MIEMKKGYCGFSACNAGMFSAQTLADEKNKTGFYVTSKAVNLLCHFQSNVSLMVKGHGRINKYKGGDKSDTVLAQALRWDTILSALQCAGAY